MDRIKILKQLDAFLGKALICLLPTAKAGGEVALQKILLIRPGGIGDAVLVAPVLSALREKHPDATIDVLAEKRNAANFSMCPSVDNVILYDQGGLLPTIRSKYDVVIDTEQWHRLSAVVARLIKSRMKIGYGTNERKKLFTHVVNYSHEQYELNSFFDLLQPLGIEDPENHPDSFLTIPPSIQKSACQLLEPLGGRPYVVLFPGASIAERRWGSEKFHLLASRLNQYGYPVVVVGGQEDQSAGEIIVSGVDGMNLAGKTSLIGSSAVVENAALLVSGDSGMLHIGVGLGKPTVSLFGSGIAAKWAPKGSRHVVLNKNLPCSPCTRFGYTPPCPINTKCLADITVDDVYNGVVSLLRDPNG